MASWEGPWHVVYAPCTIGGTSFPGGRACGMTKKVAMNYLSIFEDAIYIERTIRIFGWEIILRKHKCKQSAK